MVSLLPTTHDFPQSHSEGTIAYSEVLISSVRASEREKERERERENSPIMSRFIPAKFVMPGKKMLPYPSLPMVRSSTKQLPFSSTTVRSSSRDGMV